MSRDQHETRSSDPLVSVVTPSFQQANYLEATMRSVLDQDYPRIEYIVMDGGSTDGSVEIIRRYQDRLAYWTSAPDDGQADAVRRGFMRASGDILAYLNSDDVYRPGALRAVVDTFLRTKADLVFGDVVLVDEKGERIRELRFTEFDFDTLLYEGGNLNQAGAFWTRELYDKVGGISPSFRFSMDTDFFFRAAQVGRFVHHRGFVTDFRIHTAAKSSTMWDVGLAECAVIRSRYLDSATPAWKVEFARRRCQLRRGVRYVTQGDLGYLLSGVARRVRSVGRTG